MDIRDLVERLTDETLHHLSLTWIPRSIYINSHDISSYVACYDSVIVDFSQSRPKEIKIDITNWSCTELAIIRARGEEIRLTTTFEKRITLLYISKTNLWISPMVRVKYFINDHGAIPKEQLSQIDLPLLSANNYDHSVFRTLVGRYGPSRVCTIHRKYVRLGLVATNILKVNEKEFNLHPNKSSRFIQKIDNIGIWISRSETFLCDIDHLLIYTLPSSALRLQGCHRLVTIIESQVQRDAPGIEIYLLPGSSVEEIHAYTTIRPAIVDQRFEYPIKFSQWPIMSHFSIGSEHSMMLTAVDDMNSPMKYRGDSRMPLHNIVKKIIRFSLP